MRFKGQVQQKWADETFGNHEVCTKHWLLGIEAGEAGRSDRLQQTAERTTSRVIKFWTPMATLLDLVYGKECRRCLRLWMGLQRRWFPSPEVVMHVVSIRERMEVDRLVDANGRGLQEALAIEENFYQKDKHAQWHADGKPLKSNEPALQVITDNLTQQATAISECAEHNKHGKATLISLRYPNDGSQPFAKGTVRKTVKEH